MSRFLKTILILAASTAFSDNTPFFQQGLSLDVDNPKDGRYPSSYSAPAEIVVHHPWDVNVSAAFTYWYAYQEGMDVAYVVPAGSASTGTIVTPSFGYAPGFQIGIGIDTPFDGWEFDCEYTWYSKTQTFAKTGLGLLSRPNDWFLNPDRGGGYSTNCCNDGYASNITSSWDLHFNKADFNMGRPLYQGKNITVSPSGGLRALWIKQTFDLGVSGPGITQSLAATSSSWAVGPKFGFDTHWILWKGLRAETMLGTSLLYTKYTSITADANYINDGIANPLNSSLSGYNALRPTFDMGLGLAYGIYLFDNTFYFDLSARYDFMQYWSQNMMRAFASGLNGTDSLIGDLVLHGLTLNLRCDF